MYVAFKYRQSDTGDNSEFLGLFDSTEKAKAVIEGTFDYLTLGWQENVVSGICGVMKKGKINDILGGYFAVTMNEEVAVEV
jgi:hypothetical protein